MAKAEAGMRFDRYLYNKDEIWVRPKLLYQVNCPRCEIACRLMTAFNIDGADGDHPVWTGESSSGWGSMYVSRKVAREWQVQDDVFKFSDSPEVMQEGWHTHLFGGVVNGREPEDISHAPGCYRSFLSLLREHNVNTTRNPDMFSPGEYPPNATLLRSEFDEPFAAELKAYHDVHHDHGDVSTATNDPMEE